MNEENNVQQEQQPKQEEKNRDDKIRELEINLAGITADYLEKLMIKKRQMEIDKINKIVAGKQKEIKDFTRKKEAEIATLEKEKFSMIRKKQYEESEKVTYDPEKRKATKKVVSKE